MTKPPEIKIKRTLLSKAKKQMEKDKKDKKSGKQKRSVRSSKKGPTLTPPRMEKRTHAVAQEAKEALDGLREECSLEKGVEQNVIWEPQPGSQQLFLSCPYYEVLLHGSRGPGKTDCLLMAFAQHVGKGHGVGWRGIIFRMSYPELEEIIKKTRQYFPFIFPGAIYNKAKHVWTFPDGEELLLRHMDDEADYWSYHGHEYCVSPDTEVLTPSGYVCMGNLKIGDKVLTLQGEDEVSHIFPTTPKECVTAYFYDESGNLISEQVQSVKHRLLSIADASCEESSWQDCISLPGVVKHARLHRLLGGLDKTNRRTRHGVSVSFPEPYSSQVQTTHLPMGIAFGVFVPCGLRDTMDITVKQHHHYITRGGIVNSNSYIGWDELTNWPTDSCYTKMMACCRSSMPGVPKMIRSTANPMGVGHGWVKDRFIDKSPSGVPFSDPETPSLKRVHIAASIFENKKLLENDPEYINRLKAEPDPNRRKAWLLGSWDIVAGGALDDVWLPSRHVIAPFKIPRTWYIDRSFDWGSSRPFSVGWWAESDGSPATMADGRRIHFPSGTLFRIHELYGWTGKPNQGNRWTSTQIAQKVLTIDHLLEKRYNIPVNGGAADPAIYDRLDDESIAEKMSEAGVDWVPAIKTPGSRVTGLEAIRERLEAAKQSPLEAPGLFVFRDCKHFLRTVPVLPRSERNPDDVDTSAEDHVYDETRYRISTGSDRMTVLKNVW